MKNKYKTVLYSQSSNEEEQSLLGIPVCLSILSFVILATFIVAIVVILAPEVAVVETKVPFITGAVLLAVVIAFNTLSTAAKARWITVVPVLAILLGALAVAVNGILAFTFLPLAVLATVSGYRGRYRLVAPYIVWALWCIAGYFSTAPTPFEFAMRIGLISLTLIYPLHLVYESREINTAIKTDAVVTIAIACALISVGALFERLYSVGSFAAISGPVVAITISLVVVFFYKRLNQEYSAVRFLMLSAAVLMFYLMTQTNGLLPVAGVLLLSLVAYLVLSSFNALMLSVALSLVSVLAMYTDTSSVANVALLGILLVVAGVVFSVALFPLFRAREIESGETVMPISTLVKVLPLAAAASTVAAALMFDGFHGDDHFGKGGFDLSQADYAKELVGLILMFISFQWGFSSLWHRSDEFKRESERADQTAKQLEDTLRQTELALSAANVSVFELDLESMIATEKLGRHPKFKVGDSLSIPDFAKQIVKAQDVERVVESFQQPNHDFQFEVNYPGAPKPIWARVVTGEHYDVEGRRKGLFVRSDVTELRQSIETVQQTNQRQRELFAVVGHELRTPVAAMRMIVQDDSISGDEKLRVLDDLSDGLIGVLDDMRAVVSPERAKHAEIVVGNPVSLTKRAVAPLSHLLIEHGLKLSFSAADELDMEYRYREQALRQMVTNLVKNAALHSEGDNIWIDLSCTTDEQGQICAMLRVEDNGKGIAETELEKVFSAFGRGETKSGGTGLGLYISSELAKTLGGTVNYEAREEGGSRFKVSFPLERVDNDRQAAADPQTKPVALDGMRILVVEDDTMLRMLTEKTLINQGASVRACSDGAQALQAYHEEAFDLILTDLMMPNMNGLELIQAVRGDGDAVPIFAVTAAVIGEETDQLLAAGANTVISKPITLAGVQKALAQLQTNPVASKLR